MRLWLLLLLSGLVGANLWNEKRKRSIAGQLGTPSPPGRDDAPLAGASTVDTAIDSEYFIVSFKLNQGQTYPEQIANITNVKKITTAGSRVIILVKTIESKTELLRDLRNGGIMQYTVEYSVQQQLGIVWQLDRIDQPTLPLNNVYHSLGTAPGVNLYIVDSGARTTHEQFTGRMTRVFNVAGEPTDPCDDHASWVTGVAAGSDTGPASQATLFDLKVSRQSLDCAFYTSDGIDALTWILNNGALPGVINLSWQGPGNSILDDLIQDLYAAGFVVVAAAGNAGSSTAACTNSPARAAYALSVGATQTNDYVASYSNYGTCVDINAPGSSVVGASSANDYALVSLSGTSGSSPVVAGVAAVFYAHFAYTTAAQVTNTIASSAVFGVIPNLPQDSGNLLVNFYSLLPSSPAPSPPPFGNGNKISVF